MGRKTTGLTLLELIVALSLTTAIALGTTVMMIMMQKSSIYTRSGGTFTQQASFALQVMEKDLRYGLVQKNVACSSGAFSPKFDSPRVGTTPNSVTVLNSDSEIIQYQCSPDSSTPPLYKLLKTKQARSCAASPCACTAVDTNVTMTPAVFSECKFETNGANTITITLQGERENAKGVKSLTREIVKTIYLTDFDEGTA